MPWTSQLWTHHSALLFARISAFEIPFCRFCRHRAGAKLQRFFAVVSKLGDGHYLYSTLLALVCLEGLGAWPALRHALLAAAISHLLYRVLKRGTARIRPFELFADLGSSVHALDRYSFPSGHTLHAVAFACVISAHYAGLVYLFAPFAAAVALSRIVLGLHFPTDVAAGATLGAAIAWLALQL